jgi:capsular exopolysaccharide synthesis family protein
MELPHTDDLELSRFFFVVKRRLWVILAVAVLAAAGAFAYSSRQTDLYRATAEVNAVDQTGGLFRNTGDLNPNRDVANARYLIASRTLQDPALATLGADASEVREITTASDPDSDIVAITVTAESADVASAAANAVANEFVSQRQTIDVDSRRQQAADLRAVADGLQTQIDVYAYALGQAPPEQLEALRLERGRLVSQQADFRTRAIQLDTEADLKTGAIAVLAPAEPPSAPYEPKPWRTALVAGLVGLLLGTAGVVLYDWMNNRVSTADEVARLAGGVPILGSIPLQGARKVRRRRLPRSGRQLVELGEAGDEAYRSLAANLRFSSMGRASTRILVTSAGPGEGKTTVVANLARTLVLAGSSVAVVSADLRRPALGPIFGVDDAGDGLTSVLLGRAPLPSVMHAVEVAPGNRLCLVPAGPLPGNPPAMLASPSMADVLAQLERAGADVVLLDTAPVLPVSDTLVLAQHCDGALVVAVPEVTKKSELAEAVAALRNVETPIIGIALDGVTRSGLDGYTSTDAEAHLAPVTTTSPSSAGAQGLVG